MDDVNSMILRNYGDLEYTVENFEGSAESYEKAFVYSASPDVLLNASIAYIKISEKQKSKESFYLTKALNVLNKLAIIWDNPLVNYYKGVIFSLLGKSREAQENFSNLYDRIEQIEDKSILASMQAYFPSSGSIYPYIYDYLYEPDLINIYSLVSDYNIGKDRVKMLTSIYNEQDEEMAKARELKRCYDLVFSRDFMAEILKSPVAKMQAVALLYIWGESQKTTEAISKNSKGYIISTDEFSPLTGSILDKISKVDLRDKGLPYFIQQDLKKIEKLASIYSRLLEKKGEEKKLASELNSLLNSIGEKQVDQGRGKVYREDYIEASKMLLAKLLERIQLKCLAFFSNKDTSAFLSAIINGLPVTEQEKLSFLERFSS